MNLTLQILRKLRARSAATAPAAPSAESPAETAAESAFDARLRKLGGVRHVTVSRAVLFRTRPARQEA
ncbi:hypothetical protein [Pseudogemmobacter sonorensis]|uniref:hypothetical protein n=1 Tax=Pseudogemmobacter sonorensis TaxID=2989681 RepID=UPI00369840FC